MRQVEPTVQQPLPALNINHEGMDCIGNSRANERVLPR